MVNQRVGETFIKFSDAFFPSDAEHPFSRPELTANPFSELANAGDMLEDTVAKTFIKAVNSHDLAPGLKLRFCGNRPDPAMIDDDRQKQDAAFYREAFAPDDGMPHWADQLVAVEFKRGETGLDPFSDDPDGDVEPADALSRKKVRGQIITYAELIFAVQQRVAVFMLVVIGRQCRFIRWDRSGCIVTRLLDYYEEWEFFCDVLWRLSQCSDLQLGTDPSAERVDSHDRQYSAMYNAQLRLETDISHKEHTLQPGELPEEFDEDGKPKKPNIIYDYVRERFRESLDPAWPWYRLKVPDGQGGTLTFLVGKPIFRAKGLAGRGTRGYIAYDPRTGRFVWLKDAWRAHYLLVDQEGTVLALLNKHQVLYVPTLVCHGDIEDQETLTPQWWMEKHPTSLGSTKASKMSSMTSSQPASSASNSQRKRRVPDDDETEVGYETTHFRTDCPLRLHRHYRIVVEEVALPLSDFRYGGQLIALVNNCVFAHYQAETKAGIRHRDISSGNVLIWPRVIRNPNGSRRIRWTGLLADWEMSKPIDLTSVTQGPRQPERTGTEQFMSVALLSRAKPVETCDELEAFLYVILYHAVRYLQSNLDKTMVAPYIEAFFDVFTVFHGTYTCGDKKSAAIRNGELAIGPTETLKFYSPMDTVLAHLLSYFKANHRVKNFDNLQEQKKNALIPFPHHSLTSSGGPGGDDNDALFPTLPSRKQPITKGDDEPTEYERELAQDVDSHAVMLHYLNEAAKWASWPHHDKLGDRVPARWKQSGVLGPTLPDSMTSRKRLKTWEDNLPKSAPVQESSIRESVPRRTRPRKARKASLSQKKRA